MGLVLHQLLPITPTQVSPEPTPDCGTDAGGPVPDLLLLPKANHLGASSTTHPCVVLPSMGSTGLPGVQCLGTLGCSCPTQTARPCLQRKENGLVGATQGAGHQEDRAYCSTQPRNYRFSEKGT